MNPIVRSVKEVTFPKNQQGPSNQKVNEHV